MDTRHLVDPEVAPMLDTFPPFHFTREVLPSIRQTQAEVFEQMRPTFPAYDNIEVTEKKVPGAPGDPDVRVLVYRPKNVAGKVPGLLWIHGGGYIIGTADADDQQVKKIVTEVGCAAVSVDYRLAPETPHPGPVEDCYAALKWFYQNAAELGVDTARLAIGGASAGGGLAAGLGVLTRDRGEIPLAFQLLIYPMLDDRTVTNSADHAYVGEFIWTKESNYFGWTSLLGQEPGGEDVSPYAAAARATDLSGLPPTYLTVGSLDLFLEEDLEYARRLIRAGVPTELHVYPGGFHGFNLMPTAAISQAFERDIMAALKKGLKADQK
ncbi:MAG: alpha/beta hydrolase [Chloroflexi bacterium]|nr:alpha/beta hydrolase [Chloroflexota bacterium]OJV98363.1 MAG: arylesterase [Chloroflexi bacterium 54-19]